jgi:hypothetical protein
MGREHTATQHHQLLPTDQVKRGVKFKALLAEIAVVNYPFNCRIAIGEESL